MKVKPKKKDKKYGIVRNNRATTKKDGQGRKSSGGVQTGAQTTVVRERERNERTNFILWNIYCAYVFSNTAVLCCTKWQCNALFLTI